MSELQSKLHELPREFNNRFPRVDKNVSQFASASMDSFHDARSVRSMADDEYSAKYNPSYVAPVVESKYQPSTAQSRPVPPTPPRSRPQPDRKQVRALYDFNAENANELSIRKGDIITVLNEVDKGWWEGELNDRPGTKGLFPANYCEVLPASPPTPPRPVAGSQSFQSQSFSEMDRSRASSSYANPPSTYTQHGGGGAPVMLSASRPSSSWRDDASSVSSRSRAPSVQSRGPPSYTSAATTVKCRTCGCDSYSENAFRPGSCNSCFHKH